MLHLTHRILDVFSQPRQRFFCCVTSGKCATWSNMAALLCSGLLARLLPVSTLADELHQIFLAATGGFTYFKISFVLEPAVHYCDVDCPKKYSSVPFSTAVVYSVQCSQHARQIYAPMHLLYSFTIVGHDTSTEFHYCTIVPSNVAQVLYCSGAGVEGTLTSLFQIVLNFQWRVLQSVPPYRTDRVDAFLQ
ncbi:hypothetical protein T01_6466 [Trichinella spiralis]|uniref:Uncharacterized protein n=1 Tax=Trichinella spiralis TaxID=6334 RepID=A0A0V1B9D0_TRISP|nr:hypothetical protein T01_6466 [Trichinella spiralis]